MKYFIFSALLVTGIFRCTGGNASERTCKDVIEDLRQVAFHDADSYDLENLEETGALKYMCLVSEPDEGSGLEKLCREALKRGCK
jgi:hypothetical protein